ncbi:MAG: TonB-dependent receptor, partial [Sphingobacteriales bacterium]
MVLKINSGKIEIKDAAGKPYTNKKVSYQVLFAEQEVKRGAISTNDKGELSMQFDPPSKDRGIITVALDLADKKRVVKNIPVTATSDNTAIQFFPEGGDMICGLPGKVAVKATNATGRGEWVSGTIVNDKGAEEATFSTSKLGMGSFYFNPAVDRIYSAKVIFKDGSIRNFPLPRAKEQGYLLAVNNLDSSKIDIKVLQSKMMLKNDGSLTLIGQRNGMVYFVNKLPAAKQVVTISIPTMAIPSGIVQLTLFSADNTPVCERLVFINNPEDRIELNIDDLLASYKKRGKTTLSLTAANKDNSLEGSFSVAVTNSDIVQPDPENESNILT